MRFAVLCYDFPHWKTQMGLFALAVNGLRPDFVVGAPWKKLDIKPSPTRVVHKGLYLMESRDVCDRLGFYYIDCDHDRYLFHGMDFGVILGARILKKDTIRQFDYGIVNFHPGILPENRGLDNVKWAVKKGIKQGVTAHFINGYVDSGYIISKHEVPIYKDDTLLDVQFRVQNKEIEVMVDTVKDFISERFPKFEESIPCDRNTFKCLSESEDMTLPYEWIDYKERFAVA